MSLNDDSSANDTIIQIVNSLAPRMPQRLFNFDTPIRKRAPSTSSSLDDSNPNPAKRSKPSNDVFYIGSPREVRRIRADLLDARNTVTVLEKRIAHMHTVRKEMELMYDKESRVQKIQNEQNRKTIEELENQLQSIRKRENGLKMELNEFKSKYTSIKEESEVEIQKLDSSVSQLQSELEKQEIDGTTETQLLQRKLTDIEYLYNAAKEEISSYKQLVQAQETKLSEKSNLESEIELKSQALNKAQLQIKELEFTRESLMEFKQQAKAQQHKLSTYSELERQNLKLKDEAKNLRNEVHNKLLLEEEVHNLKGRLVNYRELEKKYTALQVSSAESELYLEEFRTLGRSTCEVGNSDASLPRLLRSTIERLQQQEINLTSEKIQLDSQLSTATHEAKVARDELEKSQKLISDLQAGTTHQKTLIHRIQKKLALISGERDSYRKQLDSYEQDLTICLKPASAANPGGAQLQSQQERIKSLEKVVDGYRDMVVKLENDLQNAEAHFSADLVPIKKDQIAGLQDEVEKMRNENQRLRDRKDQLEVQLEEYLVGMDTAQGRILHSTKNPLAEVIKQRETEKEKLEEEVDRLKRKIRKLEEGLEASRLGDITIDHKEVQVLKEQVRSSEQQIQRLKDYFKNSMQEFRNVIYMLLGYKIDKTPNSQYKLTSMYAEKSEDHLEFRLNGEGTLNLLENEFSATLEELVDLHLRQQGSIPVFLSTLTTDLFTSGTMSKVYDVDDDDDEEEEEEESEDD